MAALVAGLYGKLPAHGDFVQRGWSDATVAALDDWLATASAALRGAWGDEAWAARLGEAPAWRGHLPAGMAGPAALHVAFAASVDRPGRLFFIVAGLAGDEADLATQVRDDVRYDERLDAAIYDAVAGRLDADGLLAAVNAEAPSQSDATSSFEARWWPLGSPAGEPPAVVAAALDAPLLHRLLEVPA